MFDLFKKNSCHDIRHKGTNKQFQHLIDILHMMTYCLITNDH